MGFWVTAGSRYEDLQINGITHLIEHLLFKGTKKRNYRDIAIAFDSMGAEFNAFTDKENSCIYADFIDTHLDRCLELLFDIILNPTFLPENIKTEKKVVYEEIKITKDNPSDNIFNYFYKAIFNKHPLSLPILGIRQSVSGLSQKLILDYFNDNYNCESIVIAATGNINHKELVSKIEKNIYGARRKNSDLGKKDNFQKPETHSIKKIYKSKTKSAHLCYGGLGCRRKSKDKYALSLFTNILGGSISSRLFQKIREDLGLSYSIFATNTQYTDTGVIAIYAASSPGNVYKILDIVDKEIQGIKRNGIKDAELKRAKENTKGSIVLSVEDISSRMFRLGKGLLIDEKILTIDEILKKIDKVKLSDINDIVYKYFQPDKMSLVMIGANNRGRLK